MRFYFKNSVSFFFIFMWAMACSSNNLTFQSEALQIQTATQTLSLTVEIADTTEKQEQGLKGRDSLDADKGMLFIFDVEDYHGFWMKDTKISLDLIFLDASKTIVFIWENTTPLSEAAIVPAELALYVVEVNGGYCSQNGVQLGDEVVF